MPQIDYRSIKKMASAALTRTNLAGTSFAELFSAQDLVIADRLVVGTVPFGPAVGTVDAGGRYIERAIIEVHNSTIITEFTETGPVVERHYMRGTLTLEERFSPHVRRVISPRYEEIATGGELQIVPPGGDWVNIAPIAGADSGTREQWILNIGDTQYTFSFCNGGFVCECAEPCDCMLFINKSLLCRRVPSRITACVAASDGAATYMWTLGTSWVQH